MKRQLLKSNIRVERESIEFMKRSFSDMKQAINESKNLEKKDFLIKSNVNIHEIDGHMEKNKKSGNILSTDYHQSNLLDSNYKPSSHTYQEKIIIRTSQNNQPNLLDSNFLNQEYNHHSYK